MTLSSCYVGGWESIGLESRKKKNRYMGIRKSRCNVGFVGRTICIIKIALEHNLLEQDIFSINCHKQGIFWHLRFHILQVLVATCIIPFPSTFGIESGNTYLN